MDIRGEEEIRDDEDEREPDEADEHKDEDIKIVLNGRRLVVPFQ